MMICCVWWPVCRDTPIFVNVYIDFSRKKKKRKRNEKKNMCHTTISIFKYLFLGKKLFFLSFYYTIRPFNIQFISMMVTYVLWYVSCSKKRFNYYYECL